MSRSISRSVSLISALAAGCGGEPAPRPATPPGPTSQPSAPSAPAVPAPAARDAPDVVLINGDVWTMDPQHPRVAAVAWRGDQIVAVGGTAEVRALAGPATRVIDLHGHSASPGLIDAHCHLYGLGSDLEHVSVRGLGSEAETVRVMADAARTRPADQWLIGRGWDQNRWPGQQFPTRKALDAAVGDRPVVLERIDGHAIWVNSVALRAAGISRATKDPAGGKIVRDAAGEPTGVLVDNAEGLVLSREPPPSPEVREQRLRAAAQVAIAAGLTAVHEMGIDEETAEAYRKLAAAHQLPLRVHAYMTAPARLERLATPPAPATGRFVMSGVKLYADGALGSRGARLYEGYSDDPKNHGLWRTEPAMLARYVEAAVAGGWEVAIHAIGDAGVGAVLDAFLAAEKAHPGDHRLRVEHTQVIAPRDVPRMVSAHAIASMQPTHATSDMPWAEKRLGPRRITGAYAWRTLLDQHIPFAGGSDFPVEQVSPLLGLYAAVTRQDAKGMPPGGWYPDQRMTLLEALEAFTHGAAYAERAEDTRGVLAVGRHADLTVYSGPLAADRSLLDLHIDYTIVDGEIVFQREQASR
ncbi:MAG TPA: amidohydrolase [Kofleriaceae bacterium]|nr:amidohydrolase [Kofleriaceae bacterium]